MIYTTYLPTATEFVPEKIRLTTQNFDKLIYGSPSAWFIELYVPWCGYCVKFSNAYTQFIRECTSWSPVVRFADMNCESEAICNAFGIKTYPALVYYSPNSTPSSKMKVVGYDITKVPLPFVILETLGREHNPLPEWPVLRSVRADEILSLSFRKPIFLIVDSNIDDPTSRMVIMDYCAYKSKSPVYRISYPEVVEMLSKCDRPLALANPPPCMLFFDSKRKRLLRIDDFQNTYGVDIRTYFNKLISNTIDQSGIKLPKSLRSLSPSRQSQPALYNIPPPLQLQPVDFRFKDLLHMDDLESCINYMLRIEIPREPEIADEAFEALKNFIEMLVELIPGKPAFIGKLEQLHGFLSQAGGMCTSDEIRALSYQDGQVETFRWKHCMGSQPQYRGYPCALWSLFHILTVSHAKLAQSGRPSRYSPEELIHLFDGYIYHFFSCSMCRYHFHEATKRRHDELTYQNDAVLYLWKLHNIVNKRLAGNETEDPIAPKKQFPSFEQCPDCYFVQGYSYTWNEDAVYKFMLAYYGRVAM